MKATIYTIIALVAFAANSLFCRMALAEGYIDAWSFTIIRLLSATACLIFIMAIHSYRLRRQTSNHDSAAAHAILSDKGSWLSSVSLVIYALCFSIAYVELDTGTGALILFSAVQLTMIGWGIYKRAVKRTTMVSICRCSRRIRVFDVAIGCHTITIGGSVNGHERRGLGSIQYTR